MSWRCHVERSHIDKDENACLMVETDRRKAGTRSGYFVWRKEKKKKTQFRIKTLASTSFLLFFHFRRREKVRERRIRTFRPPSSPLPLQTAAGGSSVGSSWRSASLLGGAWRRSLLSLARWSLLEFTGEERRKWREGEEIRIAASVVLSANWSRYGHPLRAAKEEERKKRGGRRGREEEREERACRRERDYHRTAGWSSK
ncbi:hypothetical protein H5410_048838 [Solanum commersonii]|uniref:Uncharacterized protein n=1 Tax=Solanum commersonii TaxID=4109 RepID=A0A9J5XM54_SOLCO|nr:hypothetical protein H5410_048838 [Solanum commersonii]